MTADDKEWNKPITQRSSYPKKRSGSVNNQSVTLVQRIDLSEILQRMVFFTVKSAYELMYMQKETFTNRVGWRNSDEKKKHMWRRTWKLNVKRKIKHFI